MQKISGILLLFLLILSYSCKHEDNLSLISPGGLTALEQAKLDQGLLVFQNDEHFNRAISEVQKADVKSLAEWKNATGFTAYDLEANKQFPFPTLAKVLNKDGAVKIGNEYRVFANGKVFFLTDPSLLISKSYLNLEESDSSDKIRIVAIRSGKTSTNANARSGTKIQVLGYTQQYGSLSDGSAYNYYEQAQVDCNYYPTTQPGTGCYEMYYEMVFRGSIIDGTRPSFQHYYWGTCSQTVSLDAVFGGRHPNGQRDCQQEVLYSSPITFSTTYNGPDFSRTIAIGTYRTSDNIPASTLTVRLNSVSMTASIPAISVVAAVVPANTQTTFEFLLN